MRFAGLVQGTRHGQRVVYRLRGGHVRALLAEASVDLGRGRAFAAHEALDQTGALIGPLVVAAILAAQHSYRAGFAILTVPSALAMLTLVYLRRQAPHPAAYDPTVHPVQTRPIGLRGFSRTYWHYAVFTALTLAGFATFAVLGYHLQHRHVVSVAMGLAALGALASGWLYDRIGLRGLVILPLLGALVPFWSFSTSVPLVWAGTALWGLVMGIHESTMRAAVADLVPRERRGVGYGTFTAIYGLAWLAGAALIGVLYDVSIDAAITFVVVIQSAAMLAFLPLLAARWTREDRP